jgi:hypothetical protein
LRSRSKVTPLTQKAGNAGACQKNLGRIIGALICALLLLFAAKWYLYIVYSSQNCAGHVLQESWKSAHFCVTTEQKTLWKVVDISLNGIGILTATTVLLTKVADILFSKVRRHET